jgi:RNA polymerase sigma-70 factor, ECF subfamily
VNAKPQARTDEALAAQTSAGSLEAFEELLSRYEARIYSFVLNLCRNAEDARELTQDTFVTAYQRIRTFKPKYRFSAWLFTIAKRKWIDRFRVSDPACENWVNENVPEVVDPASTLEIREAEATLWETARRELKPLQFEALWLRYAEEMDLAEIAQVLGKSRTHVKVLLFRARQALIGKLQTSSAAASQLTPVPVPDSSNSVPQLQ